MVKNLTPSNPWFEWISQRPSPDSITAILERFLYCIVASLSLHLFLL